MTQITARTRPNGKSIVVEAFNADGRKIAETITKSVGYTYLVVNLWQRPSGSRPGPMNMHGESGPPEQAYTPTLSVYKRTGNRDVAERERDRAGGRANSITRVLARHTDDTYTVLDKGWGDRQTAIRWLANRDAERHQVLVDLPDGRTVRVGDPTRHFTYDQALARHEVTPGSYVRSETDPRYSDIEWATRSDLDLVGAS